jgi:hypothetical protein
VVGAAAQRNRIVAAELRLLDSSDGPRQYESVLKRRLAVAGLVLSSFALIAGLLPFTVEEGGARPALRAHCNGALIEAPPERSGGGWFGYAPGSRTVVATGALRSSVCGVSARRRVVVPLMVSSAGFLVLLAARARTGGGPRQSSSAIGESADVA